MFEGAEPLLLVGAGKMGGAMLDRWLDRGLSPGVVTILDPGIEASRRESLQSVGIAVVAAPSEVRQRAFRTVVLAVKPQMLPAILPDIAWLVGPEATVLSIVAGVRLARLEAAFASKQPIIRAMPNTPAQIGQGVTVAVPNANVSAAQRASIETLLAAVGKVAWVADEALIDAVTAVSGSGPAYVFLLAECLAEAGRAAGLPADLAALLGRETVSGAGMLLAHSPLSPDILRQNVTSPGGTTAAALSVLMAEDGLQALMRRAVEAAKARSIELG